MIRYNSVLRIPIYPIFLLVLITSCTLKKEERPVFLAKINIEDSLKKIVDFQEIKFFGSIQSFNNKTYTLLEVEIIDPPIPIIFNSNVEDSVLKETGEKVMFVIKKNLKNPEEYTHYTMKFTYKDHNWRNSSTTKNFVYGPEL
jgi:hypothetical protein